MLPWVERPLIRLHGKLPFKSRFDAIPEQVLADATALLGMFRGQIPPAIRKSAPHVRARTLNAKLLYLLTEHPVVQGITALQIIMRPRDRQAKLFVPRRYIDVES